MRARLTRPPRWPYTLNWDSPQTRGLVFFAPLIGRVPPMDLVRNHVFSWTGAPAPQRIALAGHERSKNSFLATRKQQENAIGDATPTSPYGYVDTGSDYGLTGLTTVTWEAWVNSDIYYAADGTVSWLSTRNASNGGWSFGRIGGYADGAYLFNVSQPQLTLQGVAAYNNGTTTRIVPAQRWTHVAFTLNGTALRCFVNGEFQWNLTTGALRTGGNLIMFTTGPNLSSRCHDLMHSLVVRNTPVADEELAPRGDPTEHWDIYHELGVRRVFLPAGAAATGTGGGTVVGIGSLEGGGDVAHEGGGSFVGIGTLTGGGDVNFNGGGSIAGVGALAGGGDTAYYGGGDIVGIGALVGGGFAPASDATGAGIIRGVGFLSGGGDVAKEGGGSIIGIGVLAGGGIAPALTGGGGAILGIGDLQGGGYVEPAGGGSIVGIGTLIGGGSALLIPIQASDLDITPPERTLDSDEIRWLNENMLRVRQITENFETKQQGYDAAAALQVEPWQIVDPGDLLNSWANTGDADKPALRYRRTSNRKMLQIQGSVSGGTHAESALFRLPIGFRPLFRQVSSANEPSYTTWPATTLGSAGSYAFAHQRALFIDPNGYVFTCAFSTSSANDINALIPLD